MDWQVELDRAAVLFRQGQCDEALAIYTRALVAETDKHQRARTAYNIAYVYDKCVNDPGQAAVWYRRAADSPELEPNVRERALARWGELTAGSPVAAVKSVAVSLWGRVPTWAVVVAVALAAIFLARRAK